MIDPGPRSSGPGWAREEWTGRRILTPRAVADALRRGAIFVVGLPAAALALGLAVASPEPVVMESRLSLVLDVPPSLVIPGSDASAAKVGETLVDDISRIVSGDVFAAAVARRTGAPTTAGGVAMASSLSATDRHRVIDLTATSQAPAGAGPREREVAAAAAEGAAVAAAAELQEQGDEWFGLLGADGARLHLVDGPRTAERPAGLRRRLEVPLRVAAALALGVALAVAAAWVDPRLRRPGEAEEAARAPILGLLP